MGLSSSWETSGGWSPSLGGPGALGQLVPVWALFLIGVVIGQLLPRRLAGRFGNINLRKAGSLIGRFSVVLHGLLLARAVWRRIAYPGTLRGVLQATIQWACGRGWSFSFPLSVFDETAAAGGPGSDACIHSDGSDWYVTEKDLAFFEYHALQNGAPGPNHSPWELIFDRDVPGLVRYKAWRRTLPSGKTEYKSVTTAPDVTPQEFMDMYLDDDFRRQWDGMVIHHEVLEHGNFNERQQVVRWIRRFPFAFLSDREYAIARRLFRGEDGSLTACTKAITHPREHRASSVVRMDVFYSHWRSRAVPCPWDSGRPATETVLLHHEDFKIPERLARFAVTHGMWGFVRKLSSTVPQYAEARRRRCSPTKEDPAAYGAGYAPNPPRIGGDDDGDTVSESSAGSFSASAGGSVYRPRRPLARSRAAAMLLIGAAALVVKAARGSGSSGTAAEVKETGGYVPRTKSTGASAAARVEQRRRFMREHLSAPLAI